MWYRVSWQHDASRVYGTLSHDSMMLAVSYDTLSRGSMMLAVYYGTLTRRSVLVRLAVYLHGLGEIPYLG
jgi:hypothetical protein